MVDLEKAKAAARQFGGEAEANELPSFTQDDRSDIAFYYGIERWSDIPIEHREVLLLAYRKGERLEREHGA